MYLCLLGPLLHVTALDNAVELEAAVLVDGRERVECQTASWLGSCCLRRAGDGRGCLHTISRTGSYRQSRQLRLHFCHGALM